MRTFRFRSRRRAALRLLVHLSVLLVVGAGGDAMAKSGKRHPHSRHVIAKVHRTAVLSAHDLAWQQPARRGPMRYYGGPKSQMWRAPVEN